MSVEATVREGLDALGKHPSWFAGRTTRVAHRMLRTFQPRATLIRFVSRSLRGGTRDR